MIGYPFFFFGLTGVYVALLLFQKGRGRAGTGKFLSLSASTTALIVGALSLFVFFTQDFDMPGAGVVLIPSTLLSVVFWTASLIWDGPAVNEDRLVFIGTIVLTLLMFLSGPLLG